MKGIYLDPDSQVVQEHFAVVYAPRRQRNRFPENCVQLCESAAQAQEQCQPDAKYYAAKVLGPSRSSEGLRLFYLIAWLEEMD